MNIKVYYCSMINFHDTMGENVHTIYYYSIHSSYVLITYTDRNNKIECFNNPTIRR
jgi:hypothetical protein